MVAINWEQALLWVVTGFLGAMVGTAELVSRYRDAPGSALRTLPAWLYIAINTAASLAAYKFALTMGWSFLPQGSKGQPAADWSLALVCGLSAMALFRSSLFIRRIGDKDIGSVMIHKNGAEFSGFGEVSLRARGACDAP